QVPEAEGSDHDELRQRERVAHGEALVDRGPHEVLGVAREDDEPEVPDQEERGRRHDEPPPAGDELAELRQSLDALPVDRAPGRDVHGFPSTRWCGLSRVDYPGVSGLTPGSGAPRLRA